MYTSGSPHVHCLIWVLNAPILGVHSTDDVCKFIDGMYTCEIPDETVDKEMHDLVIRLQVHKHLRTCQTKKVKTNVPDTDDSADEKSAEQAEEQIKDEKCRFSFPRPAMEQTTIEFSNQDDSSDESGDEDDPVFAEQKRKLKLQSRKVEIHLKRGPGDLERRVNPYNRDLLRTFRSNQDVQIVTNAYAALSYIVQYIAKHEKEVGEAMKLVGQLTVCP